jgi:hypothetical protein
MLRRFRGDYDPVHLRERAARSLEDQLALAISWRRLAERFAAAGREARSTSSGLDANGVSLARSEDDAG